MLNAHCGYSFDDVVAEKRSVAVETILAVLRLLGILMLIFPSIAFSQNVQGVTEQAVSKMPLAQLERCATDGDSECMRELALRYRFGSRGADKNHERALQWFIKAFDAGKSDASYAAASMLLGTSVDAPDAASRHRQGLEILRAGASRGDPTSREAMGDLMAGEEPELLDRLSLQPDAAEALRWYVPANGTSPSSSAALSIGRLHLREKPYADSNAIGVRWLLHAHREGHASTELAELLIRGRITEPDPVLAMLLIEEWHAQDAQYIEAEARLLAKDVEELTSAEQSYLQALLDEGGMADDLSEAHRMRFASPVPAQLAAQSAAKVRELARFLLAEQHVTSLLQAYATLEDQLTPQQREHLERLRTASASDGQSAVFSAQPSPPTPGELAAWREDEPEKMVARRACQEMHGANLAVLADERDPYSWWCVGATQRIRLVPPRRCEVRSGVKVAVLMDPADPFSWACLPQSAAAPAGAASTMRPAPPARPPEDPVVERRHRAFFDEHFFRATPNVFLEDMVSADLRDLSFVRLLVRGARGIEAVERGSFYRQNFGRNVVLLTAHNPQSLSLGNVERSLRILKESLRASSDPVARATDVQLLLREIGVGDEARLGALLAAGVTVWVADERLGVGVKYALVKNSLTYDLNLALVDQHGFVRAYADASRVLALRLMQGSDAAGPIVQSLRFALQRYVSKVQPESVTLDDLVAATSLRGVVLPAGETAPREIRLSNSQTAALASLMRQQTARGTEVSALLFHTAGNGVSIVEDRSSSSGPYHTLPGTPDEKLHDWLTAVDQCVDDQCRHMRDWSRRYLGEIHTHPLPYSFSYADSLNLLYGARLEMLVRSDGVVELLVPTERALSTGRKFGGPGITNPYLRGKHWLAAYFLIPDMEEKGVAMSAAPHWIGKTALRAQAMGYAYYTGDIASGTLVRRDARFSREEARGRPVLELFDGDGGIRHPIDRLRLAVMARGRASGDSFAGLLDIGPEDAFSPLLSDATRTLVMGEPATRLTPIAVERLLNAQIASKIDDFDLAPQGIKHLVNVDAPNLSYYRDRVIWQDDYRSVQGRVAGDSSTWYFCAFPLVAGRVGDQCLGSAPIVSFRLQIDGHGGPTRGAGCEVMLRITEPERSDGSRAVRYFCPDGRVERWTVDRDGYVIQGTFEAGHWKPVAGSQRQD